MNLTQWSLAGLTILMLTIATTAPTNAQPDCDPDTACTVVAMGVPDDEIAAYPEPNITPLEPDDSIIFDRNYRRVVQAVEIHDAPNGNVVGSLAAGFNFVTAGPDENGWTRINPNQYVRSEALGYAQVSRFAGVLLEEDMPYPMAWVLVTTAPSRTPGAEPLEGDPVVERYTRINLYTHVEVDGWRWYQIGPDQWIEQRLIAKVIPVERPAEVNTDRWFSIDLYEQVLIAYEGTTPVFATLVSSGLPQWATNEGVFNVYIRYERTRMSGAEGQADFYYIEDVPWTQYFDGEIGLHGTFWHDSFGYRHSHGCVNMSIMDARWAFDFAATEYDETDPEDEGAAIYVYRSGEYR